MTFNILTPAQTVDISMDDGAIIRLRRHSKGKQRLLLSHGNGFAVDAYYPFWQLFLDSFEVVVFDVRNHGQKLDRRGVSHCFIPDIDYLAVFEIVAIFFPCLIMADS